MQNTSQTTTAGASLKPRSRATLYIMCGVLASLRCRASRAACALRISSFSLASRCRRAVSSACSCCARASLLPMRHACSVQFSASAQLFISLNTGCNSFTMFVCRITPGTETTLKLP